MSQHISDSAADMPGFTRASVEEAAKILGLSENAVRKRIERGTLRSVKIDGIRYVLLSTDMPQHANDMPNDISSDIGLMQAHLDSLQEQIRHLQAVIHTRDEELKRKDHLLAAALERIPPQLEAASAEPRESPVTASAEQGKGNVAPEAEQRSSWWRRMFGG